MHEGRSKSSSHSAPPQLKLEQRPLLTDHRAAQKILRTLSTTVRCLAELRNQLGLGHGRTTSSPALTRHARLALNRAVTSRSSFSTRGRNASRRELSRSLADAYSTGSGCGSGCRAGAVLGCHSAMFLT
ncbi:abortive infection family protein [Streptomyces sp. NPDC001530]|uniref:abortive infection family protein n=1 Tax=Streptomyces sp. NPDC001530 TaxID=3364582 RepID=UPI0036AA3257